MAVNVIEGITKEPEEVKYKGIDLHTNWLDNDETVDDAYVYAYRVSETTIRDFDLTDVQYIEISTYNEGHQLLEGPIEWEMSDYWNTVKFLAQGEEESEEVMEDILVDTDNPNPNRWISKEDTGYYKIGIKNGDIGEKYQVTTKFETEAGRVELIHFPVEIVEIKDI